MVRRTARTSLSKARRQTAARKAKTSKKGKTLVEERKEIQERFGQTKGTKVITVTDIKTGKRTTIRQTPSGTVSVSGPGGDKAQIALNRARERITGRETAGDIVKQSRKLSKSTGVPEQQVIQFLSGRSVSLEQKRKLDATGVQFEPGETVSRTQRVKISGEFGEKEVDLPPEEVTRFKVRTGVEAPERQAPSSFDAAAEAERRQRGTERRSKVVDFLGQATGLTKAKQVAQEKFGTELFLLKEGSKQIGKGISQDIKTKTQDFLNLPQEKFGKELFLLKEGSKQIGRTVKSKAAEGLDFAKTTTSKALDSEFGQRAVKETKAGLNLLKGVALAPLPTRKQAEQFASGIVDFDVQLPIDDQRKPRPDPKDVSPIARAIGGKTFTPAQLEAQREFSRGLIAGALAFPREKPFQTASFVAAPGIIRGGFALTKLALGRPLVGAAKAGLAGPTTVKVARAVGGATKVGGQVALGAGFASAKASEFAVALRQGPKATGEFFGGTAIEFGAFAVGGRSSIGKRSVEVAQARVDDPLAVAATKSSGIRSNIIFAEDVGKVGLDLSGRRAVNVPQKGPPLFKFIKDATKKDVRVLREFFGQATFGESLRGPRFFKTQEDFIKGSTGTAGRLDPADLRIEFVRARGDVLKPGKAIKDLDAAIENKDVRTPKTKLALDIKELREARNIVGGREPQVFIEGNKVFLTQSPAEQAFRKAVGGFEEFDVIGGKEVFFRTRQDVLGLQFELAQAQREGFKLSRKGKKAQARIEKALEPGSDVTLPLIKGVIPTKGIFPAAKTPKINNVIRGGRTGKATASVINKVIRKRRPSSGGRPSASRIISSSSVSGLSSISRSVSKSASASPSVSPSVSPSASRSLSKSLSRSLSPSQSLSRSISPSVSKSASKSASPSISPSPGRPPKRIAPGFFIPKLELERKKKGKKKVQRQFRFTPSLVALEANIRGPKPTTLTGIEIRRISN